MTPRQWYRFSNSTETPTAAELLIYGAIGKSWLDDDAVSAKAFLDDLKALPAAVRTVTVRINSLGGDVFDAVAITNALRSWGQVPGRTVVTKVDGLAASAASVVLMAGSRILIGDNALVMVHEPATLTWGSAKVHRKIGDDLDVVRGSIVATYRWHSHLSEAELVALLEAETWMSADEAIANGFATEKVEGLKAAASLDPRAAAQLTIPEPYRARVQALLQQGPPAPVEAAARPPAREPEPPVPAASAVDVLRLCREHDFLGLAEGFITSAASTDAILARLQAESATRAAERDRRDLITAVCKMTGLSILAESYISGGMTLQGVKAQVQIMSAIADRRLEIDTAMTNTDLFGQPPETKIDVLGDYARRNGREARGR